MWVAQEEKKKKKTQSKTHQGVEHGKHGHSAVLDLNGAVAIELFDVAVRREAKGVLLVWLWRGGGEWSVSGAREEEGEDPTATPQHPLTQ